jgi:sporulation protein YlmC with PRC-barrel domain
MAQPKTLVQTRVLSASTLTGEKVVNMNNEDLGKIEDLMIDTESGRIAYAVLSFGGFLGLGDKLFAIPWSALRLDRDDKRLVLNVSKDLLEQAPGFDKNNWPNMSDPAWGAQIYGYYGYKPFWD